MSKAQNGGNVMERLTFKNGDGVVCVRDDQCYEEQSGHYCGPAIDRLADYEDLGMLAEDILDVVQDDGPFDTAKMLQIAIALDRLEKYQQAEKEGRLVVLPCKDWLEVVFGGQVLFWGIDKDYVEQPIREISLDDADRIGWYDGYKTVFLKGTDENGEAWEFYPEEIGKTVFLTREEAEKALEAMKDE